MKKVSVIIPVYNTKNEITRCIKSICNQTYSNLEIICVDDGSFDGTEKIMDELAQKDNRIRLIHQTNSGESHARNVGLQMVTGDYVAFCDCDDWIDLDMYEILVSEIEKYDVDMVAAGWYRDTFSGSEEIKNSLPVRKDVFGQGELLKYIYMRDSYRGFAYMWDKLYRKEILRDNFGKWLLFDETLQLGGDVLWLAQTALRVRRAKYVDRAFYHYNQRAESGCHTKNVKKLRDWLKAYELVLDLFENGQVETDTIRYVRRFMAYHASNAAEIAILQANRAAKEQFQEFMKAYEKDYMDLNADYPERIQRYQRLLLG